MSYENVVGGKLKLKGTALDVQSGNKKRKKKKDKLHLKQLLATITQETTSNVADNGAESALGEEQRKHEDMGDDERLQHDDAEDHRTAAEKRYQEQKLQLDLQRLKKVAKKSHRERVGEFNQYLANLSEHYDIPKVGPG